MSHLVWLYLHILLFVFWLGGDVGVWLAMAFVRDSRLSFETRATIIRLAFYVDLFPRVAFALMIPVGTQLATSLGVLPQHAALRPLAWLVGLGWCGLHALIYLQRSRPAAGPNGLTPEREAVITQMTNRTLLWALMLYALIVAIAWLGFFKPPLPA